MITGEYAVIRSAEPDDAVQLQRLYDAERPRASLLDRKRELILPTGDELRELLGRKENVAGALLAVEDRTGAVRGFCGLRSAGQELAYGELVLMLFDDADYESPLAQETLAFLIRYAFLEKRLNKVIAHCLSGELGWRRFLAGHGFVCDGKQREVLYTRGQWHDMESFTRFQTTEPAQ